MSERFTRTREALYKALYKFTFFAYLLFYS